MPFKSHIFPRLTRLVCVLAPLLGFFAVSRMLPAQATGVIVPAGAAQPECLLFQSKASSVERDFVTTLPRKGVQVVLLASLDAAEARQFHIGETPTLVRVGPALKEQGRFVGAKAISAELAEKKLAPSAICKAPHGPRLRWVEESDRQATRVYRRFNGGRETVPDIFKTMSLRPELMEKVLDLSEQGHFSNGYLDRVTKERLATVVSSYNRSRYCLSSHARGLVDLGSSQTETAALARGEIDVPSLSPKQRALLRFAKRLTQNPGAHVTEEVERLRAAGWRDEQIFEAAFDVSLFNFFNRMAATYDLETPADGWKSTLVARHTSR
jgi:uncharacterized peroxidase-related enzyme